MEREEIGSNFFFSQKKNAIILVLQLIKISLQPELSSQHCCRILGGYPERDDEVQTNGRKSFGLKLDVTDEVKLSMLNLVC